MTGTSPWNCGRSTTVFLDCSVKIPRAYTFCEDAIKARVQKAVTRGKVDVFVTIASVGAEATTVEVRQDLAEGYVNALRSLAQQFDLQDKLSVMDNRPLSGRADGDKS